MAIVMDQEAKQIQLTISTIIHKEDIQILVESAFEYIIRNSLALKDTEKTILIFLHDFWYLILTGINKNKIQTIPDPVLQISSSLEYWNIFFNQIINEHFYGISKDILEHEINYNLIKLFHR